MSVLSENVIPGSKGTTFGTNAKNIDDLKIIRNKLLSMDGVKEIIIDANVFPKGITVITNKLVKIEDVEQFVKMSGFHAIPKNVMGR